MGLQHPLLFIGTLTLKTKILEILKGLFTRDHMDMQFICMNCLRWELDLRWFFIEPSAENYKHLQGF